MKRNNFEVYIKNEIDIKFLNEIFYDSMIETIFYKNNKKGEDKQL